MTDFQVGDRVSVEGVATAIFEYDYVQVQICTKAGTLIQLEPEELTLIERPKRKLRVGSVWERESIYAGNICKDRYVWIGVTFVSPNGDAYPRETRDFDTAPDRWREVPVEELEQEAADGS